jgi:8-oxo-dGTP diphosphatase
MVQVKFYDNVDDQLLQFAVIVAKSRDQWVICKHKDRETFEVPGGHREPGETILETARRELQEETGAVEYTLTQIGIYSVKGTDGENQNREGDATHAIIENQEETFGMLYYADIEKFEKLPDFEMEQVILSEVLPTKWTYPLIQPKLLEKVMKILGT